MLFRSNSLAGLAGYFAGVQEFPVIGLKLLAVVMVAGWAGSRLGSRRFPAELIRRLLSVVLVIAGAKLIFIR